MIPLPSNYEMRQLGEVLPSTTDPTLIYSPVGNIRALLYRLHYCNVSENEVTIRLFIDKDGSTASTATALVYDYKVPPGEWDDIAFEFPFPLLNSAASVYVRASAANAVNFMLFGGETRG